MNYEENNYIMTSTELEDEALDMKAQDSLTNPDYMTDEEREYWIDGEEGDTDEEIEESYQMTDEEQKGFQDHITEEKDDEEEVLYEDTDDVLLNTLFDTCFGMTSRESKSNRRASKKRKTEKVIHLYDGKVEELATRWGAKFVRGVK